ncbi:exodeoxyribonuclease III [Paenalcaligenes sp. Me52]|uniref:exodeoxyribonuclease III n=1 Tax=Paenalcaligenes sp. Me52 TaxID=3392038 RepID=UPI003D2C74DC
MLKVTSLNLNGIRAAFRKELPAWLKSYAPDMVAMQEVRIQDQDLTAAMRHPEGYTGHFNLAERKGYSGVGFYLNSPAEKVCEGMGCDEFDPEGRVIRADFSNMSLVSAYLPSGTSGDIRQDAKYRFLETFEAWMNALMKERTETGREFIICGDWNIAHQEIDLKNWRGNQKNSGFLPEERAWMTKVLSEMGWVDVYRSLHPDTTAECYTWWSNRGQAWANNVGWRIDYQIATPGIAAAARHAEVYKAERFSDHAPLTIQYEWTL